MDGIQLCLPFTFHLRNMTGIMVGSEWFICFVGVLITAQLNVELIRFHKFPGWLNIGYTSSINKILFNLIVNKIIQIYTGCF